MTKKEIYSNLEKDMDRLVHNDLCELFKEHEQKSKRSKIRPEDIDRYLKK